MAPPVCSLPLSPYPVCPEHPCYFGLLMAARRMTDLAEPRSYQIEEFLT
jgi:hypothetical protein